MAAALLILRGIPILAYVCGVLFLGLAYERHEATHWKNTYTLLKAQDATAKIDALNATITEDNRRIAAAKEKEDADAQRLAAASAAASAADDAVGRLRVRLTALSRAAAANRAASSPVGQAASAAACVPAGLLDQCFTASAERARFAELAFSASVGCSERYDTLTPGTGIRPH